MCVDCRCGQSAPEPPAPQRLDLGERLLRRNDQQAAANRRRFTQAHLPVVNLLSAPGSGKTALLERLGRDWPRGTEPGAGSAAPVFTAPVPTAPVPTAPEPGPTSAPGSASRAPHARPPMAVIVGDLATDHDARRLWAAGLAAVQISTGQACHLEAGMVDRGVQALEQDGVPLAGLELLVIENVGNLVCPAAYDLGESLRVVMVSVTEGEDKPLKYAASFHGADLVLINKIDLLGAVEFDLDQCRRHIARVAPRARVLALSARSGAGFSALRAALGLGLARDLAPVALPVLQP
jgi:hydrogenase nickel incorporation protein HypB